MYEESQQLLRQWLLDDGTIARLPVEAVSDLRTWAWRYYAATDDKASALVRMKYRVERMRREWLRANTQMQ